MFALSKNGGLMVQINCSFAQNLNLFKSYRTETWKYLSTCSIAFYVTRSVHQILPCSIVDLFPAPRHPACSSCAQLKSDNSDACCLSLPRSCFLPVCFLNFSVSVPRIPPSPDTKEPALVLECFSSVMSDQLQFNNWSLQIFEKKTFFLKDWKKQLIPSVNQLVRGPRGYSL